MLHSDAMRPISFRSWTLVVFSAFLQLLPFPLAGPVPLWRRYFCWFCLTPLLAVLFDRRQVLTLRRAALIGYACGVLWFLGNCYWIYQTMHVYGHIPKPGALGILVLFSLYLGLYHGLFAVLVRYIVLRFDKALAFAIVPLLWVAVELARARITGFPWDLLGYTQVESPLLTKLGPVTGVMGMSFVIAGVNVLWLTYAHASRRWVGPACAGLIVVVFTLMGKFPVATPSASATLLQENLSVGREAPKQLELRDQMLSAFGQLSLQPTETQTQISSPTSIVIWPEAPTDFFDRDLAFRNSLGQLAQRLNAPVIADSISPAPPNVDGQFHVYNTASFFSANGEYAGRYDKMHLVPFGEYTPYKQLFFFAGHLLDDVGPFVPGVTRRVFFSGGHRYGVFICYESIFGEEIREFTELGSDVLVNISDDGWYGDTSAPWEHLDMVRMRAIENARWVLRATNTGVTASIDPYGRVVAEMPRHVRGSISVPFAYRSDLTFYAKHGDWFAWLCAVLSAMAVLVGLNKSKAVN